jgi:diguanylate cyclase (GGDEF)-like protein
MSLRAKPFLSRAQDTLPSGVEQGSAMVRLGARRSGGAARLGVAGRAAALGAVAAAGPLAAGVGVAAGGAPWLLIGGAAISAVAVAALAASLAPVSRIARSAEAFIDPRAADAAADDLRRIALGMQGLEARLEAAARRADPARLEDPLTGLPNRLAAMRRARDEISRARRKSMPLAVALIAVERDPALEPADADRRLRVVAEVLVQTLRAYDIVGRWDADSFVAVMPEAEIEHAADAVRRARNRAADERALTLTGAAVTLSAGLAVLQPDDATLADIAGRAEAALVKARTRGGGAVEAAPGPRFKPGRLTSV